MHTRQHSAVARALFQEAYLAQSLLCGGMTAIRRLSFDDPGRAYEGFFGLSNGIERTAKLILVSDHYVRVGSFPETSVLRSYGHDLVRLLDQVEEVAVRLGAPTEEAASHDVGCREVVRFLDRFAQKDRYHNLNRLARDNSATIDDPLSRWIVLVKKHAPKPRSKTPDAREARDRMLAGLVDASNSVSVSFHTMAGGHMDSVESAIEQAHEDEWTGVQGMLLALRPLRFLTKTIGRVNQARYPLPFYSEIFFDWAAPDSALRRRRGFPRGRS